MKTIGEELLAGLVSKAESLPRKRAHHNLHESLDEDIHRLCIAAAPGSYIRPHRHAQRGKWELLVALSGSVSVLTFLPDGTVKDRVELAPDGDVRALELEDNLLHCFLANGAGAAVLEVKRGPYVPTPEPDFAPWAPPEGDAAVPAFMACLRTANPGDNVASKWRSAGSGTVELRSVVQSARKP